MEAPVPKLPAVEYGQRSDPGRDPEKQVNEDACEYRATRLGHLCVVCDGMGGHAGGREAAELALATIIEAFEQVPAGASPTDVLREAILEANRRVNVLHTDEAGLGRPGSTVVAVLMHERGTEVAHVGDSRAYWIHQGQIHRITRDHSLVQELVDRGLITAQQAARHPDANRITRALGMGSEVEVDVRPQPVAHVPGDAFVLCSDGLSDLVEDPEILAIVAGDPAAQAVGKLIDLANARGGHDNVTVLVLRARESALAAQSGVAPTVAQTSIDPPAPSPPASATTVVEDLPAGTPQALGAVLPSKAARAPARRGVPWATRATPAVVAAILLAGAAAVLLVVALAAHFAERGGKRNGVSQSTLDLVLADAGAPAPTALAPERIVLPPTNAPSVPLAPLEPSPSEPRPRKR